MGHKIIVNSMSFCIGVILLFLTKKLTNIGRNRLAITRDFSVIKRVCTW